jgi:Cu/Ag efflux pump CusA
MLTKIIRYFLENRIITAFVLVAVLLGGLATAPFNWHGGLIPRDPIAVDAIPDIGDNQQIVATEWMGRSPKDILPDGVQPTLGPDATALGQIFWYTLEGRDPKTGKPTGGWDPQELRTIQDYYVRYGLSAADGVSEVASVGGYVKEYQVDLDADAMRSYGINIMQVMHQ